MKSTAPTNKELYESTLMAVDVQFAEILELLKMRGLLDNALVVLLSDHGEGLGEPLTVVGSMDKSNGVKNETVNDWGHGTTIFSDRQHRVMLAFRRYDGIDWLAGVRKQPAILQDIIPTLMDAIGVFPATDLGSYQGISLLDAILDNSFDEDRPIFLETGLNPKNITIAGGRIRMDDIQAGIGLYEVNPGNGRLVLKPEVIAMEKQEKAYGMVQHGRFLGILSPDRKGKRQFVYKSSLESTFEIIDNPSDLPQKGQEMWRKFNKERRDVVLKFGSEQ